MKIAHIICTFPPYKGGMGNCAYHFARILSDLGHEVTIFTPDYKNMVYEDNFEKFKIVRMKPLFKHGNAAILPQLIWQLKDFDIVHLHYPFFGTDFLVLLASCFFGKRFKLITHFHMDNVALGIKGLIFKLNRYLIFPQVVKKSKYITCASLDYVENSSIAKIYNNNKDKFISIPFGVELKFFNNNNLYVNNKSEKTILFVAGLDRAHYFKGLENLINAVNILQKDSEVIAANVKIKLDIVGGGNMLEYYQDISEKLQLNSVVSFAGRVGDDELVDHYRNCDVFTLPSINQGEAFGLVLLEAMACAKPVIASSLPGVRSVFKDGVEGLLVEPGNINDLSEKLKLILLNDELAEKMGQAGKKLTQQEYSWEAVGNKLEQLYKKAII